MKRSTCLLTGTLLAVAVVTPPLIVPPPAESTPVTPVPGEVRGRLCVSGRLIQYPDGSPFVWRGATGFLVTEQVIRGREGEARSFLRWASQTGFNVVRALAMLPGGWEDGHAFAPQEGLAALPRVFELAREAGLYVHLTVLNNTAKLPAADLGAIVEAAGKACAAVENCALLEVANEPYHGVQRGDVHDAAVLAGWARKVPAGVLVALGPAHGDESSEMDAGQVVTVHLERSRDRWNMVRRVRELEQLSAAVGKPVINSEPDGFAEVDCVPRQVGCYTRQTDPALAHALGALGRVFSVGSTFHFEDGLRGRIPGPVQQAAAAAFIAGTRVVPDATALAFRDAGWPGSPVARFRAAEGAPRDNAAVRAYSGVAGDTGVLVLLGVRGDPGVEMGSGWQIGRVVSEWPELRVVRLERAAPRESHRVMPRSAPWYAWASPTCDNSGTGAGPPSSAGSS